MNKETLWKLFKELGTDALTMTHYELAEQTTVNDPQVWKKFLLSSDVEEYITSEMKILQNAEFHKILQNIGDSKSVGQAQLINALSKLSEGNTKKEGPIIIYTYVPLNKKEQKAKNVNILDDDVFIPHV